MRATDEFKETRLLASQAESIYFVGVEHGSMRWAQLLAGFFNCKRMYFSTVKDISERLDFHEPTLVVSDTESSLHQLPRKKHALMFEGKKWNSTSGMSNRRQFTQISSSNPFQQAVDKTPLP